MVLCWCETWAWLHGSTHAPGQHTCLNSFPVHMNYFAIPRVFSWAEGRWTLQEIHENHQVVLARGHVLEKTNHHSWGQGIFQQEIEFSFAVPVTAMGSWCLRDFGCRTENLCTLRTRDVYNRTSWSTRRYICRNWRYNTICDQCEPLLGASNVFWGR